LEERIAKKVGIFNFERVNKFPILEPCDPNPCHNNGTCRTTKGTPPFFCECFQEWGGATCTIPLPNQNNRKYGKNVQLLSSGKPEWIEDLRKHKQRERKPTSGASNMGKYWKISHLIIVHLQKVK
jgi:hypothetical protein